MMFWNKNSESAPVEPLKPGICECGHLRCCHINGIGRCTLAWPANEKWPSGSHCACTVYIFDPGEDDDKGDEDPETPSPEQLERLYEK